MKYFKIKNLTNTLKKRNARANIVLEITYIDNMVKKSKKIHPDEVLFLQLISLPLSIHKMRINGLIAVNEISRDEFLMEQKKSVVKKIEPEMKKLIEESKIKEDNKPIIKKHIKKKDLDEEKKDVSADVIDE